MSNSYKEASGTSELAYAHVEGFGTFKRDMVIFRQSADGVSKDFEVEAFWHEVAHAIDPQNPDMAEYALDWNSIMEQSNTEFISDYPANHRDRESQVIEDFADTMREMMTSHHLLQLKDPIRYEAMLGFLRKFNDDPQWLPQKQYVNPFEGPKQPLDPPGQIKSIGFIKDGKLQEKLVHTLPDGTEQVVESFTDDEY